MKGPTSRLKSQFGQALAEMVLCIPILFLFAAAIIQFSLLFLSYIQFEHACGEAARELTAGLIEKDALNNEISKNLGSFEAFFIPGSLNLSVEKPRSVVDSAISSVSSFTSSLGSVAHSLGLSHVDFSAKYEGYFCRADIKFKPPAFFGALFPNGINMDTTMEFYRYAK